MLICQKYFSFLVGKGETLMNGVALGNGMDGYHDATFRL
jgi:hypothetical protein